MDVGLALKLYGISALLFVAIDLAWLGLVANGLYDRLLGDLLAERPNWGAAALFYSLFLVGLTYFATYPAAVDGNLTDALVKGALFGFFCYATWDLTSLAVLKGFPAALVPIDMAWGTALGASVAGGSWFVVDRLL